MVVFLGGMFCFSVPGVRGWDFMHPLPTLLSLNILSEQLVICKFSYSNYVRATKENKQH